MKIASPDAMISVGEELELKVYALAYGGEGIAKHKGIVIFVANALPGDMIRARILQVKKRFGRGELIKVIGPSPDRIIPLCPHAGLCGGCSWLGFDYAAQLRVKQDFVKNALDHIGHLKSIPVLLPIKSNPHTGYRHKIQIPVQAGAAALVAGFFERQSHSIVPLEECPIQPVLGNRLFKSVKQLAQHYRYTGYDEKSHKGQLRHFIIRLGARTKEALLILVTAVPDLPRGQDFAAELMQRVPELTGIVQNVNSANTNVILGSDFKVLAGRPFFYEEVKGIRYRVSAESFFQINPFQLPKFADAVLRAAEASPGDVVVDLFCGVGFLSFELARQARQVFGIELMGKAVEDAQANKHLNGITNVDFFAQAAAPGLERLAARGVKPDIVVLDPPRKGCDPELLKQVLHIAPEKVVYVSCNPTTLARDLAILWAGGYRIKQIQPVDLFPHTYHIESVAGLMRKNHR